MSWPMEISYKMNGAREKSRTSCPDSIFGPPFGTTCMQIPLKEITRNNASLQKEKARKDTESSPYELGSMQLPTSASAKYPLFSMTPRSFTTAVYLTTH